MIDNHFIRPFVQSMKTTIQTMLLVTPVDLEPLDKNGDSSSGDVSGIVGLVAENFSGSVALSFPSATIFEVYKLMMGEQVTQITPDVRDTVGELTNIVVGSAKRLFAESGQSFDISIPIVISGKDHLFAHPVGTVTVVVPFKINSNPFAMEISLKTESAFG